MLSGAMLFRHIGWSEAASSLESAIGEDDSREQRSPVTSDV